MLRRVGVPVVVSLAVTAGLALADAPRSGPAAHAAAVRLPVVDGCVQRSVRMTLAPPAGTVFASLSVRLGDDEVLQLASLAGPGSLKVALPYGRTRIRVSATTADGRFVRTSRTYRRCVKPTPPKATPTPTATATPLTGGGDQ
ncbi:MAG: hypothetical protein QOE86_155 [Solirubrobacteraceae bacterium]|nr:hypothetical protein [Solirubrobacteraceae bacterium]